MSSFPFKSTFLRRGTPRLRATVALWIYLFTSILVTANAPLERFEFSQPQMGVPFKIILYAADVAQAKKVATAAYARISVLNTILSNYETDSELSQLGYRSGIQGWTPVSSDLFRIISRSQRLSQVTDGAFDLTIGPVAASWRNARRTKTFPKKGQLSRFLKRVGWQHLKVDYSRRQICLNSTGMRLDPGGIAKGDALDQALMVLQQHGIESALVAGAGDIAVTAPPPGREAWRIQLSEFNEKAGHLPTYVDLKDQAIATSGDFFQFVEIDGIRYSHIVDPKSGIGLTERRLVTVIASRGIEADSLATALSVLDLNQVESTLDRYPGASARILLLENETPVERFYGSFHRFVDR
jgi:thiamine biosynthesis lipoprotein